MRTLDNRERRARLAVRHHLAPKAKIAAVETIAGDLVGLHGSDPATVFMSAAARLKKPASAIPELERTLYDDRTMVRTLCMRRTMFVVPLDLVPIVQAACTDALVPGERKRLVQMIEEGGIAADGKRWLRKVEAATVAALDELGEAVAADLTKRVPGLRKQLSFGEGKTWAGTVGMSTRVLFLLAAEQRVARGRPRGAWTSSQYRWSPMSTWLPDGIPAVPADIARAELLRRWLAAYGPATTTDVKWWTGWTVAQTKAALAAVEAEEVALEDGTGWVLPGDIRKTPAPGPWVALLPGLDSTTMGWKERTWFLSDHEPALFDRNGNAGPTVWVDGRAVGAWTQRKDGEVVYELLADVGRAATTRVAKAASDLEKWLGAVRVTPRFPTPLQKALASRS